MSLRKTLLLLANAALGTVVHGVVGAQIPALIETHCADCHSGEDPDGDLDLDALFAPAGKRDDAFAARLEAMAQRVRARTMPPPDDVEPLADGQRRALVTALAEHAPVRPGARVATMRRLTRRQYERSVRALFGIRWRARDLLPDDATAHGFEGIGDVQNVSPLMFEKFLDAAGDVATAVLADDRATARTFGDGALGDRTIDAALRDLLPRAYRRPVEADEVRALTDVHAASLARGAPVAAARHAVLRALLASPSFLFRAEHGRADDPARL
ncbi:MAG: DUF1587 domain-containing protein, partial [Planctomycetes bacterium]|nr:DUF1587 domain-containing protein [Planctomycetota bacterium]